MKNTIRCPSKDLTHLFVNYRAEAKRFHARGTRQQENLRQSGSNTIHEPDYFLHEETPLKSSDPCILPSKRGALDIRNETLNVFTRNKTSTSAGSSENAVSIEMTATPKAASISATTVPPLSWIDVVEETREDLTRVKELLSSLQKAQRQQWLRVFDTQTPKAQREMETLSYDITQLLKRCEQRIFRLEPTTDCNPMECRIRRNAQKSLALRAQHLSEMLRQQQYYGEEFYNEQRKKLRSAGDSLVDMEATVSSTTDNLKTTQLREKHCLTTDTNHVVATEDSNEVAKVAAFASDLHSILTQLSGLVIEQSTLLDRIDYNIEQTAEHTRQGTQQLHKAERARRSSRVRRIIISLLAVVLLQFVLLMWKYLRTR